MQNWLEDNWASRMIMLNLHGEEPDGLNSASARRRFVQIKSRHKQVKKKIFA